MNVTISILMNCVLSTTSIPASLEANRIFTGTCTGTYQHKGEDDLIGAWSMELRFTPTQGHLRAEKLRGGVIVPEIEGNAEAIAELEQNTVAFAAREVLRRAQTARPLPGGHTPSPAI